MASANEDRHPLHPSDSSTMLEDVSGAERDLDEVSTEISESVEGDADPSASAGAADAEFDDTPSDAAGPNRRPARRALSKRERTVRQIHAEYETSPFVVWFRMMARFLASALATAGLGASAAIYPLYAITPTPILEAMFKGAFNVGYLIYTSFIGRWLHLRMVRSTRASRRAPHSRGVRPTPLSTCSILPVPFLNDNYSYLLVDHATRETAAIDPADPYTIGEVTRRLSLRLTAILTTHKHHDHAGGNLELQKACGGSLRVYGHAKDTIPGVTRVVEPGDRIMIGETEIGVVHVPCHTTGHVVYVVLRREDGAAPGRRRARGRREPNHGRRSRKRRERHLSPSRGGCVHGGRHHQRRRRGVFPRRASRLLRQSAPQTGGRPRRRPHLLGARVHADEP